MILYSDTSVLLKLYIEEDGAQFFREQVAAASGLYTHMIAYAELRAALAKAQRMGRINLAELSELVADVDEDWLTLSLIDLDMRAIRRAGGLAERFGLRGYDSVHLAAAERMSAHVSSRAKFQFAVVDGKLAEGARALGINVLE